MRVIHSARNVWLLALFMAFSAVAQQETDPVDPEEAFLTELQEPVLRPYEARIVVESQSDLVRRRAMSEGLQQVIVNLLGNEDALFEPEIRRALRAPQQYVMQFSYEKGYSDEEEESDAASLSEEGGSDAASLSEEDGSSAASLSEEDGGGAASLSEDDDSERQLQTFLKLHFLQRRVNNLLRAANQIEAGELQVIDIEVQGVVDFADYASTLTALQRLAMVRDVSPVLVQAETVEFSLQFEGDVEKFTAAVEEQTRLQALDYSIDPVFADRLSYELDAEAVEEIDQND